DFGGYEGVLRLARQEVPVRLLGFCLMPNHWLLVLWPRVDGDLSDFLHWLTMTHTQRWHAHYHTAGTGPLYQGRFRCFPIQEDEHLCSRSCATWSGTPCGRGWCGGRGGGARRARGGAGPPAPRGGCADGA